MVLEHPIVLKHPVVLLHSRANMSVGCWRNARRCPPPQSPGAWVCSPFPTSRGWERVLEGFPHLPAASRMRVFVPCVTGCQRGDTTPKSSHRMGVCSAERPLHSPLRPLQVHPPPLVLIRSPTKRCSSVWAMLRPAQLVTVPSPKSQRVEGTQGQQHLSAHPLSKTPWPRN